MSDLYLYKSTHLGYLYLYLKTKFVSGVFVKIYLHTFTYIAD